MFGNASAVAQLTHRHLGSRGIPRADPVVEKKSEVPRRRLVAELDAQSKLYSTERLADGQLYQTVEIDLRGGQRTK